MTKDVIDVMETKKDAWELGYADGPSEIVDGNAEFHYFTETSQFANNVLPTLRLMSGFKYNSMGTHTESQELSTQEGEVIESRYILDEVQEAYQMGWEASANGEDRNAPY